VRANPIPEATSLNQTAKLYPETHKTKKMWLFDVFFPSSYVNITKKMRNTWVLSIAMCLPKPPLGASNSGIL